MTGTLALELVLDRATSPISGTITAAGTAPRPFSGWTDLFACLREVVDPQPAPEIACTSES